MELLYQHLRGVGTVSIKTWERETGGRRQETFVPHSAHISSCLCVCGDGRCDEPGRSFPLPSAEHKDSCQLVAAFFLPSEARMKSGRSAVGSSGGQSLPRCSLSPTETSSRLWKAHCGGPYWECGICFIPRSKPVLGSPFCFEKHVLRECGEEMVWKVPFKKIFI